MKTPSSPPASATASASAAAPAPPEQTAARPIRSFVLRAGRLTSGQARATAQLAPRYVVPYAPGVPDWAACFASDPAQGVAAPLVLEIGFGMGDATAQIAAALAQTHFIGCEVHPPGVGALLLHIQTQALANVRIVAHDAVEVLRDMIAPDSLAGVHIFFPDPWHKTRHHKRRLIQPPLVALLASRLQVGGYVHCATDWQNYAEQMLAVLQAQPLLANRGARLAPELGGYAPRPAYRPLTKFERRGLRLGHGVWDLVFERCAASPPSA